MSKNLSGYEVLGGLGLVVIAIVVMANWDSWTSSTGQTAVKPVQAAPKQLTIRSGAVICFSREDWESFKSAVMDNHVAQLKLLFDGGKCQKTTEPMSTTYLDPVAGNAALVQTPGGRGAFVFLQDTK